MSHHLLSRYWRGSAIGSGSGSRSRHAYGCWHAEGSLCDGQVRGYGTGSGYGSGDGQGYWCDSSDVAEPGAGSVYGAGCGSGAHLGHGDGSSSAPQ